MAFHAARFQARRFVSFDSILNRFKNSDSIITDSRQVTSSGPFAEPASFSAVGSPSSLLDVKLPASAILNLRLSSKTSIVGINGDVDNLVKEITSIKSPTGPILYQRIYNSSPLSLLISNHLNLENFTVIDVKEKWSIKRSNLIAWYGCDIIPRLSDRLLGRFSTIDSQGEGSIALKGKGHVFRIDLQENESMFVNPLNILAYSARKDIKVVKLESKLVNYKLPQFTSLETISVNLVKARKLLFGAKYRAADSGDGSLFKSLDNYLKKRQEKKTNDKLYDIKGPATLILQNNI